MNGINLKLSLNGNEMNESKKEKAIEYFEDHLHCSQSVLAAFAEECGITEEQAFRLGSCFGSGMRKGNVCGACTGALMVIRRSVTDLIS